MFGVSRTFSEHHLFCDSAPTAAVPTTTPLLSNFKFMGDDWHGPCVGHMLKPHQRAGPGGVVPFTMTAGTLTQCWWDCKMEQPLGKRGWQFLTKLNILFPVQARTCAPRYVPKWCQDFYLHKKKTCTQMCIVALFAMARAWKQPGYPSGGERIHCDPSRQWTIVHC